MKKICVIGNFGSKTSKLNGQTIKTKMVYDLLKENNEYDLRSLNSYNWKKRPFSLFFKTIRAAKKSDIVIFLPAHNGIKVFLPLLTMFKSKKTKLILCAIGSWLPELLRNNTKLLKYSKLVNEYWVETKLMIEGLNKIGLNNVYKINNFKPLTPNKTLKTYNGKDELKLCIFSRVSPIKGINDAIDVVSDLNKESVDVSLDIYGPIEDGYGDRFYKKMQCDNIKYHGSINPLDSTKILSKYHMLLFPTRYIGEGIPGTIIDALFSGLPILTSEYPNAREIMNEDVAVFFKFCDKGDLKEKMKWCIKNPNIINSKRENCLKESFKYSKEYVSLQIFDLLEKL